MRNYIQPGNVLTVPAPAGGVLGGDGVLIGALFGIASHDAAEGEDLSLQVTGVVDLPKAAGALAVGARVYFDATSRSVTATDTGNTLIGVSVAAALAGDTLVRVRLNGSF
ncbi:MAG: DUF2190 family protein [Alphaproteobacteria bacterium]